MKETTIFREALGDTPVIRVIEFLIEGRELDYSLTDIAENSNIGWTTLHRIWDNLLKFEILTVLPSPSHKSYTILINLK